MIKKFIKGYMIRSTIIGIFSLIGNSSQNSTSDILTNKYWNSNLEEINEKNLEKITERNLLFYSEKDKTEYRIGQNLNFYKPK